MNVGFCVSCGVKIPISMRKNARFCCEEHRKAYWELIGRRKCVENEDKAVVTVGGNRK